MEKLNCFLDKAVVAGRTIQVAVLDIEIGKAQRMVREYLCAKNINHENEDYYTFVTTEGCVICLRGYDKTSYRGEAKGCHFYCSYVSESLPNRIKVEVAQRTQGLVFFG